MAAPPFAAPARRIATHPAGLGAGPRGLTLATPASRAALVMMSPGPASRDGAASSRVAAVGPTKVGACYVFRPPAGGAPPKGIVHFLGGAFVGAAPQVSYGALLTKVAAAGYVVVATPFRLRFDYLTLCDAVRSSAAGLFDSSANMSPHPASKQMYPYSHHFSHPCLYPQQLFTACPHAWLRQRLFRRLRAWTSHMFVTLHPSSHRSYTILET